MCWLARVTSHENTVCDTPPWDVVYKARVHQEAPLKDICHNTLIVRGGLALLPPKLQWVDRTARCLSDAHPNCARLLLWLLACKCPVNRTHSLYPTPLSLRRCGLEGRHRSCRCRCCSCGSLSARRWCSWGATLVSVRRLTPFLSGSTKSPGDC